MTSDDEKWPDDYIDTDDHKQKLKDIGSIDILSMDELAIPSHLNESEKDLFKTPDSKYGEAQSRYNFKKNYKNTDKKKFFET